MDKYLILLKGGFVGNVGDTPIRKYADDPDQTFDLIVTEYAIRELDENGKEKLGEPLYRVVK